MAGLMAGKIALVTGAASGIGRASALAFAREGAHVVIGDLAREGAEETVGLIEQAGGEASFLQADVSSGVQVEALLHSVVQLYGRLDCAHNNAGIITTRRSTVDTREEDFDRIVAINLKGVWLCLKYEIEQMLRGGGGAIVNTASTAGLTGSVNLSAYVASKHGVVGLTKTAALEYARSDIRVNAICPGATRTGMITEVTGGTEEGEARMVASRPTPRVALPEEMAEAAVWLCSDKASFVNGHMLVVDGAFTAA